jgi:hypothetical protein
MIHGEATNPNVKKRPLLHEEEQGSYCGPAPSSPFGFTIR